MLASFIASTVGILSVYITIVSSTDIPTIEGLLKCNDTITDATNVMNRIKYYELNLNTVHERFDLAMDVTFDSSASDYRAYLYVYDNNFELIESYDDCTETLSPCEFQEQLTVTSLFSGSYIVGIGGYDHDDDWGTFQISIECDYLLLCNDDNPCSNLTLQPPVNAIRCIGNNVCSYMSINASYMDSFSLTCTSKNNVAACDALFVDVQHAHLVNIQVRGYKAMIDSIILATFIAKYIKYSAIGDFASNNVQIYGENAVNIDMFAKGKRSFVNSSIYAQNAKDLTVTCWNGNFNGETCFNSNIYLSSFEESNTLNCRFGCERINLYFANDIDVSLFKKMTFALQCFICQTIEECIDEWRIYYDNYNYSVIYSGDNNNNTNESSLLSDFSDYVDDEYVCIDHQEQLQKDVIFLISMVIFILSVLPICIGLIGVIINLIILWYKKVNYIYISNKPSLLILLYSIVCDIIIWIAICWWLIKMTMLYDVTQRYCSSKYQYEDDKQYCIADRFCDYYPDIQCVPDLPIFVTFIVFWIIFVILMIIETCIICRSFMPGNDNPVPDCLMCMKYQNFRNDRILYREQYATRTFWIARECSCVGPCNSSCNLFGHLMVYLYRYCIYIIMTAIIVVFAEDFESDYTIKSYEFYPILVLILIKLSMQIGYTYSPKYKEYDEIATMLEDKFGHQIFMILKMYIPMFHDESICSSGTIVTGKYMTKFGYSIDEKAELIEMQSQ